MKGLDARIREKIRSARPHQKQLASHLGKSQTWVSKYLAGGSAAATIDDIVAMADFLNVDVAHLLGIESLPKTAPRKTRLEQESQ